MTGWRSLSRRAFIGGSGAAIALPFLESLVPRVARAQGAGPAKRLLFYFIPNGIHMAAWTPSAQGAGYGMTPILKPLEPLRNDFSVITGLANLNAKPDGAGDHASGTGAFITCAHPRKTEGSNIQNGISADQIAAQAIGKMTRFPSLQLGIDGGASAGRCDSGYSCAYARNISWASATQPLPKLTNPQTVFDRLFEGFDPSVSVAEQEKRRRYKKSVLDFAISDAQSLNQRLGTTDRRKVDEFLTGVRDLERQIATAAPPSSSGCGSIPRPAATLPYQDHVKVMADLMVIAMQCDLTRVISFMLGNAGSNRSYSFIGVSGAHHQISHHQGNPSNFASLQKIDIWEVQQLYYLLNKMKNVTEGSTNLLYNSAVFFSSEISDGNRHNHTDYPVILAGHAGGSFKPGRHIAYPVANNTKLSNLLTAMVATVGVANPKLGDSTASMTGL